jgi:alpha-beta hydrolase superfamily lysophospholipase
MSLFISITLTLTASLLLFPIVLHLAYRAPRLIETSTPQDHQIPFTQHYLSSVKDKKLYSWYIPSKESQATLVIAHGWGANMEMMLPIAKPFYESGLDVLIYDARNHGQSDADSFSSLPRFAEDLDAAVDWLKQHRPEHQIVILGHSIGAAAALLSASRRDDIKCLIGLSGFAHPKLVMSRHLDRPWLPSFISAIIMEYIQWVIGYKFDDIAPMNRISQVRCPVLLAHGTDDKTVPISDMHLIEQNATQSNVSTLSIEGARHNSVKLFNRNASQLIEFIKDQLKT